MNYQEFIYKTKELREKKDRLFHINEKLHQIYINQDVKASIGTEIQSNNNINVLEMLCTEKVDLEKEKNELIPVIKYAEKEITDIVTRVQSYMYKELLYYRYVKCLNWNDVSTIIGYSTDHVRGIMFRKAREELKKILS